MTINSKQKTSIAIILAGGAIAAAGLIFVGRGSGTARPKPPRQQPRIARPLPTATASTTAARPAQRMTTPPGTPTGSTTKRKRKKATSR